MIWLILIIIMNVLCIYFYIKTGDGDCLIIPMITVFNILLTSAIYSFATGNMFGFAFILLIIVLCIGA